MRSYLATSQAVLPVVSMRAKRRADKRPILLRCQKSGSNSRSPAPPFVNTLIAQRFFEYLIQLNRPTM